jgi:hypothetical protein
MNPWPRRVAYLLAILVWLLLISLPLVAFTLAARNQIQLGSVENSHIRLFLIQESNVEGIGVEVARPYAVEPTCTETSVRYFMWAGEPENVTFCQCRDSTGAYLSASQGSCRLALDRALP